MAINTVQFFVFLSSQTGDTGLFILNISEFEKVYASAKLGATRVNHDR